MDRPAPSPQAVAPLAPVDDPLPRPRWAWFALDVLVCVALVLIGAAAFHLYIPLTFVGSDSVDPLWRAFKILTLRDLFPPLHSPVAGYGLYYNLLPAFVGAGSLEDLSRHRWWMAALVPVPVYVGARLGLRSLVGAGRGASIFVGLLAGLWLALSPDLADTPLSGARTYLGPLWASVATGGMLAALGGRARGLWWVGLALPMGAMNHPFMLALVPATLAVVWWGRRQWAREAWAGLAVAAVVSLPHGVHLVGVMWDRGLGHTTEGSSLASGFWPQLARSFHDGFLVHSDAAIAVHALFFLGPLLLMGVGGVMRGMGRRRQDEAMEAAATQAAAMGGWAAAAVVSLVLLSISISYVQHYHLRVLWPALAVAGAWGLLIVVEAPLSRAGLDLGGARWTAALIMVALGLGGRYYQPDAWAFLTEDTTHRLETLQTHRRLSEVIAADAQGRPRIVDAVHIQAGATLYPPAIVLDQILGGTPEAAFPTRPEGLETADIYLMIVAPDALLDRIGEGMEPGAILDRLGGQQMQGDAMGGVMTVALKGAPACRAFSQRLCGIIPEGEAPRLGTVYNYMAPLDADFGAGWVGLWFDPCLMEQVP